MSYSIIQKTLQTIQIFIFWQFFLTRNTGTPSFFLKFVWNLSVVYMFRASLAIQIKYAHPRAQDFVEGRILLDVEFNREPWPHLLLVQHEGIQWLFYVWLLFILCTFSLSMKIHRTWNMRQRYNRLSPIIFVFLVYEIPAGDGCNDPNCVSHVQVPQRPLAHSYTGKKQSRWSAVSHCHFISPFEKQLYVQEWFYKKL